jgi:hypothetical protein
MWRHRGQNHAGICSRTRLLLMAPARTVTLSVCLAVGLGLLTSCTGPGGAGTVPQAPSLTATSSGAASNPTEASCRSRTVSLGPLLRRTVITEISDVTHVRRGDPPFDTKLRPVRSVVPAVEGAGVVDATFVYATFAQKAGPGAAEIGEESPREGTSGEVSVSGGGAIVVYTSVQLVEASFTERCGGIATSGVVRSWTRSRTGLMQCDLKPQRTDDVVKEAVSLTC